MTQPHQQPDAAGERWVTGLVQYLAASAILPLVEALCDIRRGLVAAQPDNLDFRRGLGIVLTQWAHFLPQDAAESRVDPRWLEACRVWTELATLGPLGQWEDYRQLACTKARG